MNKLKVLNIMLAPKLGGIEQSFLDYTSALRQLNHDVVCIITQNALVKPFLDNSLPCIDLRQFADWDPFAIVKLRRHILKIQPDVILCHGNRAFKLVNRTHYNPKKVIGICHNYKTKHLKRAHHLISVSEYIRNDLIKNGYPSNQIDTLPNMLDLDKFPQLPAASRSPFIIGAMGRFVGVKGFDTFIHALKILNDITVDFHAVIGGDGPERDELKKLAQKLDIAHKITFCGWVQDKKTFFEQVNIFCLPSRIESFGIVALEGMAFGRPIVSTKTIGPLEFLDHERDSLLVEINDAEAMAKSFHRLMLDPLLADKLVECARQKVTSTFAIPIVAQKLNSLLAKVIS